MLYGNARRHRRIGEAGIEEMETRKHSSSLLRIQAYAGVRARAPVSVIIFRRLIALFKALRLEPTLSRLRPAFAAAPPRKLYLFNSYSLCETF